MNNCGAMLLQYDLNRFIYTKYISYFQVGAQTGHKVTLVDVSQDVLDKVRPIPTTAVELYLIAQCVTYARLYIFSIIL